jgi:integral membrane protein
MTPRILFRSVAVAEAITWALLLIGMYLKYVTETTEVLVSIGGALHGFVFLAYLVSTAFVWVNQRWSAATGALGLLAGVSPFATVLFDWQLERRGKLDGGWRLAAGKDRPSGPVENLQAWVLRNPLTAVLVAIIGVSVVFAALLIAGPPVQVG